MQLCIILYDPMNKCKRNIDVIRLEVQRFISNGLANKEFTQQELAKRIMVNQATISRYQNGQFFKVTSGVKKLCKYAGIDVYLESKPDPEGHKILSQVIFDSWDGTMAHARQLAKVIKVISAMPH